MTCNESEVLVHALLDGELEASRARALEAYLQGCPRCAPRLQTYRAMRRAISTAPLRFTASMGLRRRIEAALAGGSTTAVHRRPALRPIIIGSALFAAMAATFALAIIPPDQDQRLFGDLITAHVRSLEGENLTDVRANDLHTVKPWFSGKIALAPPVVDLATQGFQLVGARLDHVAGKAVASIVYRRSTHVINLFVTQPAAAERGEAELARMRGFNVQCWTAHGLEFFAVSDLAAEELQEFSGKLDAAMEQS
jgi:anti-sigma factor RsiW